MVTRQWSHGGSLLLLRLVLMSALGLLSALLAISQAQVTLDGSLGPKGALAGPNYTIPAAIGQVRGPNVFHSFGEFNVRTGESATFTGPNTINNILSRVTGGQPSSIDGVLRSDIPGANVFLLNPSGVMFGPNASLDVRGSFHVSTADYLRLADGERFSTRLSERSGLSIAPPVAFGFLGVQTPAAISIEGGKLQVDAGNTLSVVGGDIQLSGGSLTAPSGRINIASVASAGEVIPNASAQGDTLDVGAFTRLGHVALANGVSLDVSSKGGGGMVVIRGGRLELDNASLLANTTGNIDGADVSADLRVAEDIVMTHGATITANVGGAGRAGDVQIQARSLDINNQASINSNTAGAGPGSNINIAVERLTLGSGGQINASTSSTGRGGAVTVRATASITITGPNRQLTDQTATGISAATSGPGAGGQVVIAAPALTIIDTGFLTAQTTGGTGSAGEIEVKVGRLTLTSGGFIDNSTFRTTGTGNGGTVTIQATEAIRIVGRDSARSRSAIAVQSVTGSRGNGGQLLLSAPTLEMDDGGLLRARTTGAGNAGEIDLQVGRLTLTGGAFIDARTTLGAGQGGTVIVTATEAIRIAGRDSDGASRIVSSTETGGGPAGRLVLTAPTVTLEDGGAIQATTSGAGVAGTIEVTGGRVSLTGGSQISGSTTGAGQGGIVTVTVTEALRIAGRDSAGGPSRIESSTTTGSGAAGQLNIAAPTVMLEEGGVIRATTAGVGNAGIIEVKGESVSLTGGAQISGSTSGAGQGGTVTVEATKLLHIAGRADDGTPSRIESRTGSDGVGGDLQIQAQRLEISDGGSITAASTGQGDAGMVQIKVDETFRSQHGSVSTAAEQAGGGNITLEAQLVHATDSDLTATVRGGTGGGGNVTINSAFTILNGSKVVAQADLGKGGNINITAQEAVVADPRSLIDASAQRGINGTVDIRSPVTNISGTVAPLPQSFASAAALLRERCAPRRSGNTASRFVLGGRDGVPTEPGGILASQPPVGGTALAHGEEGATTAHIDVLQLTPLGKVQTVSKPIPAQQVALDLDCARWSGAQHTPARRVVR